MKTTLPESITSVEDAQKFLSDLHYNNESYHPEDNAHDIVWTTGLNPTADERNRLNKLMNDIYFLPGQNSADDMVFDPCEWLLNLPKMFLWKDKTGRGFTSTLPFGQLMQGAEDEEPSYDGVQLADWLGESEEGDEWENAAMKITRIN